MTYCLNPACSQPENPLQAQICLTCRAPLLLQERYRPLKRLGKGGFGRTFLALDLANHNRCVIKQSLALPGQTELTHQRFRQEAERLQQLGQHQQIPKLLAHLEENQHYYLVQEFMAGANLAEALAQSGPLPESQIRHLLHNLLPVLHFIHRHQVIHRDIKPANIIRSGQQYVLVDFGAACLADPSHPQQTGTMIGTAEYTAPEQVRGKAVFASDLYSLGVTCLHLLTQMSPFDLYDSGEDRWVWRDYLGSRTVSEDLGYVLDRLVENATKRRFASAYDAIFALNPLQAKLVQLAVGRDPDVEVQPSAPALPPPTSRSWVCRQTLLGHPQGITAIAIHPERVVTGGVEGGIRLWHLPTGQETGYFLAHQAAVTSIALTRRGECCVSGSLDQTLKLWHLPSQQELHCFQTEQGGIRAVAVSPDGQTLAVGSTNSQILLWDFETGVLKGTLKGHSGPIRCLAFSRGGEILASGSEDAMIRLWDPETGTKLREVAAFYPIFSVQITPDGQWLIGGGYDSTLKIWDLISGKMLSICTDHANWVTSTAITPDGQILASGSDDYTIKLRHLKTRQVLGSLTGHHGRITALQFSADGHYLLSGCTEGFLKFWQTGRSL
ncbi:MAG: serine/threonine-protein kinase [Cyanobacteriota bacterium]|nr:serine/threonine-protein kinase [Cyanobacteriota bacterium]